jgi:hypothetical protein
MGLITCLSLLSIVSLALAAPVYKSASSNSGNGSGHDVNLDEAGWLDRWQDPQVHPQMIPSHDHTQASQIVDHVADHSTRKASNVKSSTSGVAQNYDVHKEARRIKHNANRRLARLKEREGKPKLPMGRPPKELHPLDPLFAQKLQDRARNAANWQRKRSRQTMEGQEPKLSRSESIKQRKAIRSTPNFAEQYLSDLGLDLGNVDWEAFEVNADKGKGVLPESAQDRKKVYAATRKQNTTPEKRAKWAERDRVRRKERIKEEVQAKAIGMSYKEYKDFLKHTVGSEEEQKAERRHNKNMWLRQYRKQKKAEAMAAKQSSIRYKEHQ